MNIGIIGAGKTGCSIGKYLKENGISITGYFSKTKKSVDEAATFTNTNAFSSVNELLAVSDIIFITTPDDSISKVWENIADRLVHGKIVCHFSGSLSSNVFSKRDRRNIFGCSIHPMYAFSSKFTSYKNLKHVIFTMEGDSQAIEILQPLFQSMGNKVCLISSEEKTKYHAAASMISNMMIGLYQMSIQMLIECGFESSDARQLVEPLVRENIKSLLASSPEEALTGPIERGDISTVKKHLTVLNENEKEVYAKLGQVLTGIAGRKNPKKDYSVITEYLTHIADD